MARTSTKNKKKSGNAKGPKVVFTKNASERSVSGKQFIRLNDDEKFTGFALFDPDPAAEDNPGYVEYGEHWDNANQRFVPCWGVKNGCIYCKAGAQPSQRAQAAFLVTNINGDELEEPEVKLFRLNWTMIQEWIDTLEEDGSTLGQKIRIKCVSRGDGDFTTKFFEKDRMTKKDIKAAVKDIPDIEDILQRNLDKALEALRVSDVLEDDDEEDDDDIEVEDDDDDDEPKAKKNTKSKSKKKDDDDEEDDEEDEEEEDDDEEDDEEEDDESDDDDDEESDDDDDEEESDDDEEESDDDDDDEEDEEEETLTGEFTVVSANEDEMTVTLKELDSDLYFSESIVEDVDFDDLKKSDKVRITAEKDDADDWVATEFNKLEKKKSGSAKKDDKKKKDTKKKRR